MAFAENILPKAAAYYTLNNASINNSMLTIGQGGYAEINITESMLAKLTKSMLIVIHPSVFSSVYTNTAVYVTLDILTVSGVEIHTISSASVSSSGVFNTTIELPDEAFVSFKYRISSKVEVVVYNWELCAEEAADVTEAIAGVEQTIPKLLYDYNSYAYSVGQNELTVGLISCLLRDATDLQGHFTLSFFASERCNVHVRVKDNGVTELFSPLVYTVEAGYASISIPHAYLKKKATTHAFSVSVQCTNGLLSIPVRGLLYTIDGGYLATRLLDAGIDILDISIKQLPEDSSPSEIYAIGFEGNHILLKSRIYNQMQRADWTAIKDFGEGTTAAIEFDGRWNDRPGTDKYTLETLSLPYAFIVDTEGNLTVYSEDNFSTELLLDTGVSSISVCKGYGSKYDVLQDQGLIISYVKNGNVYYRQRLYNAYTESYMWYPAEVLHEDNDASFVSVHRLPDYRVGFLISYAEATNWLITDRTYVSQTYKPEIISTYVDTFNIISVLDADRLEEASGVATQNEYSSEELYHNDFTLTYNGNIALLNGTVLKDLVEQTIVRINNVVIEDAINTVTINGNVIIFNLKNAARSGNTVRISFDSLEFMAMVAYNGCYVTITKDYTWVLPEPIIYAEHNAGPIDISVSGTATIEVIGNTKVYKPQDHSFEVSTDTTVSVDVYKLNNIRKYTNEEIQITAEATTTLEVKQTGEKPV